MRQLDGNIYTTQAGMTNYLWTVSAGGTITAGGSTIDNTVTVTWTTTGAQTVSVIIPTATDARHQQPKCTTLQSMPCRYRP